LFTYFLLAFWFCTFLFYFPYKHPNAVNLAKGATGRIKMQVRKNQVPGMENASTKKSKYKMCKDGKCKYGKMKLAQASTDGATIHGSRCERDITKHPNKHDCELKK